MAKLGRSAQGRGLAVLLPLALAYGCAASSVAPPLSTATASRSRILPNAFAPGVKRVFLADAVYNIVTIFDRAGTTRKLGGFNEPQLLTTDGAGDLYVANTEDADVEVFAPPYRSKATLTIPDPGEAPVDVAVAKDGTVAVINICQGNGSQCRQPGSIVLFASSQATAPCATISGGTTISGPLAGAFDANGTLYVDGVNGYTTSIVGVIAGECKATRLAKLEPTTSIHFAAGLQVDTNGNIAIVDSGGPTRGTSIDVFAPPESKSRRLKLLSQQPLLDSTVVVSFALTKDGRHLYTAEPHYSLEYSYPAGGYLEQQLAPPPSGGDLIEGVALVPAEVP